MRTSGRFRKVTDMSESLLSDLFADEGLFRVVALCCATITTGQDKDVAKGHQQTLAVAETYLEWLDHLADVPLSGLPAFIGGKR